MILEANLTYFTKLNNYYYYNNEITFLSLKLQPINGSFQLKLTKLL